MHEYIPIISKAANVVLVVLLVVKSLEIRRLRKLLKIANDLDANGRQRGFKIPIIKEAEVMSPADASAHEYPYCYSCASPNSKNPQLLPCHHLWKDMPDMWCSGCKAMVDQTHQPLH